MAPRRGRRSRLRSGELTIGRAASCNVRFNHPSVGKTHARLIRTDSQVTIEDLKSAQRHLRQRSRAIALEVLRNGDRISLGGVAQFRVTVSRRARCGSSLTPSQILVSNRR